MGTLISKSYVYINIYFTYMKSISLHVLMNASVPRLALSYLQKSVSAILLQLLCVYKCVCVGVCMYVRARARASVCVVNMNMYMRMCLCFTHVSSYFLHDRTGPLRPSQRAFHIIPENIYFCVKKIITLLKN